MSLDPTISEVNLFASLRKYLYTQATTDGLSISFDDEEPDMTQEQWVNVGIYEPGNVAGRGKIMADIRCAANGANREFLISALRDTIVGWLARQSIPLYQFHDDRSDPTQIGSFFVENIFPGRKLPGDGGMLYRHIIAEIGFFAKA